MYTFIFIFPHDLILDSELIQFVKVVFAMRLEFRLILLTNIHDPIVLHKINS